MKTIYRDSSNEELVCWDNIEDAHAGSIQSAAWELHNLICNNSNYVDNMYELLKKAIEISKACNKLKEACNGKKVEVYQLQK